MQLVVHTDYHWQFRKARQALVDIWPSQYKYRTVSTKHAAVSVTSWQQLTDQLQQLLMRITAPTPLAPRSKPASRRQVKSASIELLLDPPHNLRLLLHTERGMGVYRLQETARDLLRRLQLLCALDEDEDDDDDDDDDDLDDVVDDSEDEDDDEEEEEVT